MLLVKASTMATYGGKGYWFRQAGSKKRAKSTNKQTADYAAFHTKHKVSESDSHRKEDDSEDDATDEGMEGEEDIGNAPRWKESLSELTGSRQNVNLVQHVYGKSALNLASDIDEQKGISDDESEDDDFFKPKGEGNKPIERKTRKFNPLVIPKSLQQALPFVSKPKNISERSPRVFYFRSSIPHEQALPFVSKPKHISERSPSVFYFRSVVKPHEQSLLVSKPKDISERSPRVFYFRRPVVEPHERKTKKLIQHLKLVRHNKEKKRSQEDEDKRKPHEAEKAKDELVSRKRQREEQLERSRLQNKLQKRNRIIED